MKKLFLIMSLASMATGHLFAQTGSSTTQTTPPVQFDSKDPAKNFNIAITSSNYGAAGQILEEVNDNPLTMPALNNVLQSLTPSVYSKILNDATNATDVDQQTRALSLLAKIGDGANALMMSAQDLRKNDPNSSAAATYASTLVALHSLIKPADFISLYGAATNPKLTDQQRELFKGFLPSIFNTYSATEKLTTSNSVPTVDAMDKVIVPKSGAAVRKTELPSHNFE